MLYLIERYKKGGKHCHLMGNMHYSNAGVTAGVSLILEVTYAM